MANGTFRTLLLSAVITAFTSAAIAQESPSTEPAFLLSYTALKEVGLHLPPEFTTITEWSSQLATLSTSEEFTLYWEARAPGSKALTPAEEDKLGISRRMVVKERKSRRFPPGGQGNGQVWGRQFVFVAVDGSGEIKGIQIQTNPRSMFWDAPNPDGTLSGGEALSSTGSVQLLFPADPSIQRILVYQRTPDEKTMHLHLFTTIEVDSTSTTK